jgi:hypothetical protein
MKRCPLCDDSDTRRIEFGYPGPQMTRAAERGEIVLGGCYAPPEELGTWRQCMSCGREFNEQTGQAIEDAYAEYMQSLGHTH